MLRVLALVVILCGCCSSGWAQDAKATRQFAMRYILEENVKKEFEHMIAAISPGVSEEQRREGTDGLKMAEYNKAYGTYVCWKTTNTEDSFQACTKKFMAEFQRFFGLSDYAVVIGRVRLAKCEMQSRLFDAEIEFPPYDFLKGNGIFLFDLAKYNACVTAN